MKIMKARNAQAFTLIELMVMIVVLVVVAGLLLPAGGGNKQKATQINCVNNLKQVGLSFRMWASDNGGSYPMHYQTNDFIGEIYASQSQMFTYFQVLSNELSMPKVVHCPADKERTMATNFTSDFNSKRVSYFVGLDAKEDLPQSILAGDRNLGEATGAGGYTPPSGYGYSDGIGGSYVVLGTNSTNIAWSDKMHQRNGNMTLGDGSVQKLSTSGVRKALRESGLQTNRLVFP